MKKSALFVLLGVGALPVMLLVIILAQLQAISPGTPQERVGPEGQVLPNGVALIERWPVGGRIRRRYTVLGV